MAVINSWVTTTSATNVHRASFQDSQKGVEIDFVAVTDTFDKKVIDIKTDRGLYKAYAVLTLRKKAVKAEKSWNKPHYLLSFEYWLIE